MFAKYRIGLGLFLIGVLFTATGCPSSGGVSTVNQGGGSIISVASKISGDDFGGMTADEWQIVTIYAPTLADQFGIDLGEFGDLPILSDEEAEALVEFLDENNVTTYTDMQVLAVKIQSGEVVVPDILMSVVQQFFA